MAHSRWRPTRWQRLRWWLEDWAPGESLSGYVEFLSHRFRCWAGLPTELAVADWPKKPEKRVLPVTIDVGLPSAGAEFEPPLSAEAVKRLQAYRERLEHEAQRGKRG